MCFEHERIHLETSSVLISEKPLTDVTRPLYFPPYHHSAYRTHAPSLTLTPPSTPPQPTQPVAGVDFPVNRLVSVPASPAVTLGKPRDYPSYGWDNEYGERTFAVPAFEASQFKVSNGEVTNTTQHG